MKSILKIKVIPGAYGLNNEFKFNVQQWHSYDNGRTFVYCGFGRFCRSAEEVDAYTRQSFTEHAAAQNNAF